MNSTKILYWKHMICCLEDGRDPKWEIEKSPYIFFYFDWKLSLMIPMYAKVVYCTTNCKYLGLIRQ